MTYCPHCGEALYPTRVWHKINKNRSCNCGKCTLCKNRILKKEWYQKNRIKLMNERRKKRLGKNLSLKKLNAYWDKVKTI